MQIAIIQTEAADFVKIQICVILKTFGHDGTMSTFEQLFPINPDLKREWYIINWTTPSKQNYTHSKVKYYQKCNS